MEAIKDTQKLAPILTTGKAKLAGQINPTESGDGIQIPAEQRRELLVNLTLGLREMSEGAESMVRFVLGPQSRGATLHEEQRSRRERAYRAKAVEAPAQPHRAPGGWDNAERPLVAIEHEPIKSQ